MRIEKGKLAISIAIPLIVGAVSGLANSGGMQMFAEIEKPPLSPPGWLFPVVWTILYTLMGISSYLIWTAEEEKMVQAGGAPAQKKQALRTYAIQLAVNFFWPFLFFGLEWYLAAFFWLVLLWYLILTMIRQFKEISPLAAKLNIPYLLWVTFAGYLNLGIWWLNR